MNNDRYFDIFMKHHQDKYALYTNLEKFIEEEIRKARGEENAKFFDILRQLIDSENNAGWEDRHSERINLIGKTRRDIADSYDEFLP